MRKKILPTGLITIVIASAIVFSWWNYGLFSNYNYFTAKRDIKNGNVKFISFGLPMLSSKDSEIKMVMTKYGFKERNVGCTVTEQEINAIETYNNVVEQYLTRRNGENWRATYKKEIDSLYKIAFRRNK